jgi:hypothetical protein
VSSVNAYNETMNKYIIGVGTNSTKELYRRRGLTIPDVDGHIDKQITVNNFLYGNSDAREDY